MAVIRNVRSIAPNPTQETLQISASINTLMPTRIINIKVNLIKIAWDSINQLTYIYDSSQSNLARGEDVFEPNFYTVDFNTVTSPAMPSAFLLYLEILNYLEEISSVSGGATAGNQQIQIDKITDFSGVPSVFKDAFDFTWFRYLKNLERLYDIYDFFITRPANIIPYTIGDAINGNVSQIFEFLNIGLNGGTPSLLSITVFDSSNQVVKPIFNYAFFKTQPTIQNDNSPVSVLDGFGLTEFVGAVSGSNFSAVLSPNTANGNSVQQLTIPGELALLPSNDLFVIIYLNNAYTPTASEQFHFQFKFKQNF